MRAVRSSHARRSVAAAACRTGDSLPVPSTSDFQIMRALVMIMPAGVAGETAPRRLPADRRTLQQGTGRRSSAAAPRLMPCMSSCRLFMRPISLRNSMALRAGGRAGGRAGKRWMGWDRRVSAAAARANLQCCCSGLRCGSCAGAARACGTFCSRQGSPCLPKRADQSTSTCCRLPELLAELRLCHRAGGDAPNGSTAMPAPRLSPRWEHAVRRTFGQFSQPPGRQMLCICFSRCARHRGLCGESCRPIL